MVVAWVVGSIMIFAVSDLGVALCRQNMLGGINHDSECRNIQDPHRSWQYSEMVRVPRQLYPENRIRTVSRFLRYEGSSPSGPRFWDLVFGMKPVRR
jgi:hypothetical protein